MRRGRAWACAALLGDDRPGVGLRADGLPDINWHWIKGGKVTIKIRSDPDNPNSAIERTLTATVKSFWMARYPVTITQFQAFLADCHHNGTWRVPGFPVDLPGDYPPPKHR